MSPVQIKVWKLSVISNILIESDLHCQLLAINTGYLQVYILFSTSSHLLPYQSATGQYQCGLSLKQQGVGYSHPVANMFMISHPYTHAISCRNVMYCRNWLAEHNTTGKTYQLLDKHRTLVGWCTFAPPSISTWAVSV